jgi:hypothetical protein
VFCFGLFVPTIIVNMKILARRTQRLMAKIVSDQAQIDLLISHMRTGGMAQPVGRCTLKQISADDILITALPQTLRCTLENLFHDRMQCSPGQCFPRFSYWQ